MWVRFVEVEYRNWVVDSLLTSRLVVGERGSQC
jgi:hypothetical protein